MIALLRLLQDGAESLGQRRTIGQIGQVIVVRHMPQHQLGTLTLGDIPRHAGGANHLALAIKQRHLQGLGPGFAPPLPGNGLLAQQGLATFQHPPIVGDITGSGIRRGQIMIRQSDQRLGLAAEGFAKLGIAMIPQPTSEAWLICSCKPDAYQHCSLLETQLSGNDRSPERAPKQVLGQHLGNTDYHRGDLWPVVNAIDLDRMDMPTFNQLRADLCQGIEQICGSHTP